MKLSEQVLDTLRINFAMRFMAKHPLIIGNNCLSSYVYYYAKRQFNSPFVWASLSPNDMLFLMDSLWDVNMRKVEFDYADELIKDGKIRKYVKARIDDTIDVNYVHYLKFTEGKKKRSDIISENIIDIAREKYFNRLQRLESLGRNVKPFFMFNINSSEDMLLEEYRETIPKMGNRKDVHMIYQRTDRSENTFNRGDFTNLFIYDRSKKTGIQGGMLYTLLEYLNDQCK